MSDSNIFLFFLFLFAILYFLFSNTLLLGAVSLAFFSYFIEFFTNHSFTLKIEEDIYICSNLLSGNRDFEDTDHWAY